MRSVSLRFSYVCSNAKATLSYPSTGQLQFSANNFCSLSNSVALPVVIWAITIFWNSPEAEQVRKKVRCCDRDCWMIGSVSPAMKKYIWVPGFWVAWHKFKALFTKKPYSMYENKIVRDYRDGKVTKEQLDQCSTCDLCADVSDGLSDASRQQLKDKTGEEIVDADIAAQMK